MNWLSFRAAEEAARWVSPRLVLGQALRKLYFTEGENGDATAMSKI